MRLYPNINLIFFIWVIALFLVANFGLFNIPKSDKFSSEFFPALINWDGGHFLSIAQFGYTEKFQYAFFPLYPLFVNILSKVVGSFNVAAILISIISSFLGFHILYKLIAKDFSKQIAQETINFIIFFPVSFFLLVAYSEGLFFFLTVLTFYFLRQNKLLWATLAVMLVSATRITGLAVVIAFLLEVILTQGINKKNWFVIFSPLGFFAYCWFLFSQTLDPFYFVTAEGHWQRQLTIPGVGFWESINLIIKEPFSRFHYMVYLDLVAAIFGLGLILRSFRFLPISYPVFGLVSILFPLFTTSLTSMPRFLLPIFPIFLTLALIKNSYLKLSYQIISLMLLGLLSVLFIAGYWVS